MVNVLAPVLVEDAEITGGGPLIFVTLQSPLPQKGQFAKEAVFRFVLRPEAAKAFAKTLHDAATAAKTLSADEGTRN